MADKTWFFGLVVKVDSEVPVCRCRPIKVDGHRRRSRLYETWAQFIKNGVGKLRLAELLQS